MPKKAGADASVTSKCLLAIQLKDLPKLQIWSLPLASSFDLSSSLEFTFPQGTTVSEAKLNVASNNHFVRLKINHPNSVTLSASKINRFDWTYLRKMFGSFVEQLESAPDGTRITIQFGRGNKAHWYRGIVNSSQFSILETSPSLSDSDLKLAWQLSEFYGEKSIKCRDAVEADAFESAWPKYKNLQDEIMKRNGLQFTGQDYCEQLPGCLFQLRHAAAWQLRELKKSKTPPKTALQKHAEKYQAAATPTVQVSTIYDELCKFIDSATRSKLKKRTIQQLPPKLEWVLLTRQAGARKTSLEFLNLAAMAEGIFMRIPAAQYHAPLKTQLPESIQKAIAFGTQPVTPKQWKTAGPIVQQVIVDAFHWFEQAFIDVTPTPDYPMQPPGEYLFESHAPSQNEARSRSAQIAESPDECTEENESDAKSFDYDRLAQWNSVSPGFRRRLTRAYGKGNWRRAELSMRIKLFDWDQPFIADVHWYAVDGSPNQREPWRMKSLSRAPYKIQPIDALIECQAPNAFAASLQIGKRYQCSARMGQKYNGYLRVTDESNEEYWYPETFFSW